MKNCYQKKVRKNIILSKTALDLLNKTAKHRNMPASKILEILILQKLSNPIELILQEKRELAQRMAFLDDKQKHLENISIEETALEVKL